MSRVYLDANIFIAAFETEGALADHAWSVLGAMERGDIVGVTSELTLAELLPKPLRTDWRRLAEVYRDIIRDGAGLLVPSVGRDTLIASAELRTGATSLKLPDAIHIATAVAADCRWFLSGDRRLPLPDGMRHLHSTATTLDAVLE